MADFGLRLRLALGKQDQQSLARASGVDAGGISRYLRGKGLVGLTATNVIALARALGVAPGWLLTGEGVMRGEWRQIETDAEPGQSLANKPRRPDHGR